MVKLIKPTERNFIVRILCKLLHWRNYKFIDTKGRIDKHLVCLGHSCFKRTLVIKKMWVENEFKEKIN